MQPASRGGNAAHPLQQVQAYAFVLEQDASFPLDLRQHVARRDRLAIALPLLDAQATLAQQPRKFRDSRHHSTCFCQYAPAAALAVQAQGLGGKVSPAEIGRQQFTRKSLHSAQVFGIAQMEGGTSEQPPFHFAFSVLTHKSVANALAQPLSQ